jgi:hypothetical protein
LKQSTSTLSMLGIDSVTCLRGKSKYSLDSAVILEKSEGKSAVSNISWVPIFLVAAILEVGGDAAIRYGFKKQIYVPRIVGFLILGLYGFAVNWVNRIDPENWSLSKMLGVYVIFFASVSLFADLLFPDGELAKVAWSKRVPCTTWVGLLIVIVGGLFMQYGQRIASWPSR